MRQAITIGLALGPFLTERASTHPLGQKNKRIDDTF